MQNRPGSVGSAAAWMFGLSILLFWLPIVGPLIAGFVGGRKAGTVGNAILAALLPGIVFGVLLFFVGTMLTGVPLFGFIAGFGGLVFALVHVGFLLIAAIIGAAV
jgi:hypothetical protein